MTTETSPLVAVLLRVSDNRITPQKLDLLKGWLSTDKVMKMRGELGAWIYTSGRFFFTPKESIHETGQDFLNTLEDVTSRGDFDKDKMAVILFDENEGMGIRGLVCWRPNASTKKAPLPLTDEAWRDFLKKK